MKLIALKLGSVFFLLIYFQSLFAQDLFDYEHTKAYSRHLMRSRKYDLAASELQRLIFIQPNNDTFKVQLLKSYRLAGKPGLGITQWQDWKNTNIELPSSINYEYAKILLTTEKEKEAISFAAQPNTLLPNHSELVTVYGYLLLQDWDNAEKQIKTNSLPNSAPLMALTSKGRNMPHKSPLLAASLSAVLPGAGKAYTKDWADGVVSLVFVGLNTWQAWRRFDREGSNTVWGYVHGGFALGFYAGNIYGSHKAARMFNNRQKLRLRHETEHLIYPALD